MTRNAMRWILGGVLIASALAHAADAPKKESQKEAEAAMCSQPRYPCQHDVRIVLRKADGSTYAQDFPVFNPVLQDGFFTFVPGQTVYIEAELDAGKVRMLRAVNAPLAPGRTIVAKFAQDATGMTLHLSNPFDRTVKFDLGIMPLEGRGEGEVHYTSSCPLAPGGRNTELWSEAIFMVVIQNGRVIEDETTHVCV